MYCQNCGNRLSDEDRFCRKCGLSLHEVGSRSVISEPVVKYELPLENKPVSPWTYAWLYILFLVPIVGFITCIILSFNSNVNIRNVARAVWCIIVIIILIIIVVAIIGGITGTTDELFGLLNNIGLIEMEP